jgi:hypothetical protein
VSRAHADAHTLEWLLAGDPSIRWQTLNDLTRSPKADVMRERRKVATEGWGARLLAAQDWEGSWARGLYTPKWTSTTYTMLLLRDFGLPEDNAHAQRACALLLERGMRSDGGIGYGGDRSETCITGMVLSILTYFRQDDPRLDRVLQHLLERQMPDGGWNCRLPRGATHASVHTTISVLEALLTLERMRPSRARTIRKAARRGREFLLVHRLFRSHRTGNVINPAFSRFAFPPRWHYDILRALDHFRAARADRDERLEEAIAIVRSRSDEHGRWPLEKAFPGKTHFTLETTGRPSRWNTLRALRVLRWWDA